MISKAFNKIQISTTGAAIFMEHGGSGRPVLFCTAIRKLMRCGIGSRRS